MVQEAVGPLGQRWPDGTPTLVKLVAWAAWGLHLAELADAPDTANSEALSFHPDCLHHGDWLVVRRIEADPRGPDGDEWAAGDLTLNKLVAWAQCGHFLLGNGELR